MSNLISKNGRLYHGKISVISEFQLYASSIKKVSDYGSGLLVRPAPGPRRINTQGFEISQFSIPWWNKMAAAFSLVDGGALLSNNEIPGSADLSVRIDSNTTNSTSTAYSQSVKLVFRGGLPGFEHVEDLTATIMPGSPVGTTVPVADIVKGNHLFTAVFPVYCWSDTARTANISRTSVDDYLYASVNGGNPYAISGGSPDYGSIQLKAGWNKIVFVYENNAWSGAYLYFNVAGVTSWWSPTADNLHNCVGKLVKDCLPDLTITTNNPSSAGLENNVKGMFYYKQKDGNSDLPPAFLKAAFPSLDWTLSGRPTDPKYWTPLEALPNFDHYFLHTNFRFYTDQRISEFPAPAESVRWPIVQATKPSFDMVRFYVDMTAMIARNEFSNGRNKVQVRGTFSNWNPVFGWQAGAPYNENVYVMEVRLLATSGQQFDYKFYADGPGWESFTENRKFTAVGGEGADLNLPVAYFNNLKDSGVLLDGQKLTEVRLGTDRVTAIYCGSTQVYP